MQSALSAFKEATTLERSNQFEAAIAAYQAGLKLAPESPDAWFNFAVLLRRLRHFDAALSAYARAIQCGVSRPEEAHLNRAVIYSDCLQEPAKALAELHASLNLNPTYVPALLNLGNLHEDLGRRAEAVATYERILTLDAHCYEALARQANASPATLPDDPIILRLRRALADPDVKAEDRASLGFALGKSLDNVGDYAAAFQAYSDANAASRQSAPHVPAYDRAAHEAHIDSLIRVFNKSALGATSGSASTRPIFICGMFRSGSTLIERMLAAHSRIEPGGELNFIPLMANTTLKPFPEAMTATTREQLTTLASYYSDALQRLFPGDKSITDKRPDNFLYLGLIKRLFPKAKIIHTTRDPLDNCLSIFFLHLDQHMSYALDLLDIGHYYRQYRRLMNHWKALYGADILEVNYDFLVCNAESALRSILNHCDLEYEPACLEFHHITGSVKTASVWQIREPLYQRASGRAQHYRDQVAALEAYLRQCPESVAKH